MHEMSIAIALKEQVEAALRDRPDAIVREIDLEMGAMQLIVPQALTMAWEAVVVDTALEGSILNMKEISISAECRNCGTFFQPELQNFVCPQCGQADADIQQGSDVLLRAIQCDIESASTGEV